MAVTAWQGNQPVPGAGGTSYANNNGVPTPLCYPFTDPMFQAFTVQQYLTVAGVNPAQTYAEKAPVEEDKPKTKAGK